VRARYQSRHLDAERAAQTFATPKICLAGFALVARGPLSFD
jgi:acyl dehydratase